MELWKEARNMKTSDILIKMLDNNKMQEEANEEHLRLVQKMIQEQSKSIDIIEARVDNLETTVQLLKKHHDNRRN